MKKIRIWMAIDRPMEATATTLDPLRQAIIVLVQSQNQVEMVGELRVDLA